MEKLRAFKSGAKLVTMVLSIPSAIGNIDTKKPGAWKLCYNLHSEEYKMLNLAEKHKAVVLRVAIHVELNEFHFFILFNSEEDAKRFLNEFKEHQ